MNNKKEFMGFKRIMLAFTLIITCLHANVYGQDVIDISLEQPGKLKKVLKQLGQKDPMSITHLKVSGAMNDKDIQYLSSFSNLMYLDVSEAGASHYTYKLDITAFKKLSHIYLSNVDLDFIKGNISSDIEVMIIPENESLDNFDLGKQFINKVYIGEHGEPRKIKGLNFELESSLKKDLNGNYSSGKIERIKVDTLYVPNMNSLYCNAIKEFDPCFVVLQTENKIILNRWKQSENQPIVNLQGVSYIMPFAFNNISNLVKVECPESIEEILDYTFYGCKNLRVVELKNVKTIGDNAFENTEITEVTLPNSLKEISAYTFLNSSIKEVEFSAQYPPVVMQRNNDYEFWGNYMSNIRFQIPNNSLASYYIGLWKNVELIEKGANTTFEITLETPGNMQKCLTDEIIVNAENLKVNGILYDTDFELLKKCKNIRLLDLSNCFICKLPETINDEENEHSYIQKMLGATGLSKNVNNKPFKSSPNCIIPSSGFSAWKYITEIKLPLSLEEIGGMSGCIFLEKVSMPETAKRISNMAFKGCKNLKEINFPSSIEYIGKEAFSGCESLYEMNLANTKVKELKDVFGCYNSSSPEKKVSLEFFYAPKTLKGFSNTPEMKIAYFYSREVPKKLFLNKQTKEVHVPKGSLSNWSKVSKSVTNIFDDIK